MTLKPLAASAVVIALAGGWFVWAKPSPDDTIHEVTQVEPKTEPGAEAPLTAGKPAHGRFAFVINSGDAGISVYDVDISCEVRRIPLLREPHHMALSPDHRFLLVGDTTANANAMLFLNPMTGDIEKQVSVSDPYQFGFDPTASGSSSTGWLGIRLISMTP